MKKSEWNVYNIREKSGKFCSFEIEIQEMLEDQSEFVVFLDSKALFEHDYVLWRKALE